MASGALPCSSPSLDLANQHSNRCFLRAGLGSEADGWVKEYDEAKQLAQDVLQLVQVGCILHVVCSLTTYALQVHQDAGPRFHFETCMAYFPLFSLCLWLFISRRCSDAAPKHASWPVQERNTSYPNGGPEASRMTATARRKTGTLGTQIDKLFQWLDSAESSGVSEQEKYRRRDNLHALKSRREQLLVALKRNQQGASNRESLMAGSSSVARVAAIETEATAALDNRGLLQLQQNVIQQQDQELEYMERTIGSTKHIALTIGEHLDARTECIHACMQASTGHTGARDVAAMLVHYTIATQRHGYVSNDMHVPSCMSSHP